MKTPKVVTPQQYEAAIDAFILEHCEAVDGKLQCKVHHSLIEGVTVYVSLHSETFEHCGGGGDVIHVSIPYCLECEGPVTEEQKYSCVHVPHFTDPSADRLRWLQQFRPQLQSPQQALPS